MPVGNDRGVVPHGFVARLDGGQEIFAAAIGL